MFEELGFETLTPVGASLVAGLVLGGLFGIFAQRSRFCLRRGIAGAAHERTPALAVWLLALGTALLATQALVYSGLLSFAEHRFMANDVPFVAIVIGGLLFGAGMVLTRGCASRLTVLTGQGNLRALTTLLFFAVVAHATLKGVLAPLRVWFGQWSVDIGAAVSLGDFVPGGGLAVAVIVFSAVVLFAARSGASLWHLIFGAGIGLVAATGWIATGFVLYDEFDPITFESLAFTSTSSDTLFWVVAGTAIAPAFGVGILGGTLAGSFLAAVLARELHVESFDTETPVARYLAGGSMMGFGGVLAGGCTVGAGISGVATLSAAALLALAAIVLGAKLMMTVGDTRSATLVPAE